MLLAQLQNYAGKLHAVIRRGWRSRFETIDYTKAKEDVLPFIKDPTLTALWSEDFFKQITNGLQARWRMRITRGSQNNFYLISFINAICYRVK